MKKRSVLIRRAALLAAIAVIIAVAVGLSVFFIIIGGQASSAAQQGILVPALIAGAAAVVVALVAAELLAEKIMIPVMEPVARLRDVAVAMSEGDLDQRADEEASGELGELGKAVNRLSYQLSRNMYTLIVERNRLRNMLNGLSEGIVAIDAKGEITHTNPALDRLFTRQKTALHLPDPRMKLIPDKSIC